MLSLYGGNSQLSQEWGRVPHTSAEDAGAGPGVGAAQSHDGELLLARGGSHANALAFFSVRARAGAGAGAFRIGGAEDEFISIGPVAGGFRRVGEGFEAAPRH